MKIRRIASAASVAAALALAGPAVAGEPCPDEPPSPCPDGYIPVFDVFNVFGVDDNDNDIICGKTTPTGEVFVDDRG